jgi:hypothetical protein
MSEQFIIPVKVKIETIIIKGSTTTPSQQGRNRALSDHQSKEAEEDEASVEGITLNQEDCTVYSTERTKGIKQEPAKLRYKNRRKWLRPKHARANRSKFFTLLRATRHISQSMWVTNNHSHNLQLQLLWQVTLQLGGSYRNHLHWLQLYLTISSLRGSVKLRSSVIQERSQKLE